ncbi:MAG: hypothetical protein Q9160_000469 [Pyrenula sp. 1 TL-2023]
MANQGGGGFMVNPLPSPAPSQASSVAGSSDNNRLPIARSHPLKAGSQKEIIFINHVDAKILNINRRYAKKFTGEVEEGVGRGYDNFSDVADDLNAVFDVVWISATRGPITTSTVGHRQRIVSLTDQVRIRSITELTRVTVVDKLSISRRHHAQNDTSELDETTEDEGDNNIDESAQDTLMQSASRLYVYTVDLLGDSLVSAVPERD